MCVTAEQIYISGSANGPRCTRLPRTPPLGCSQLVSKRGPPWTPPAPRRAGAAGRGLPRPSLLARREQRTETPGEAGWAWVRGAPLPPAAAGLQVMGTAAVLAIPDPVSNFFLLN